MISVKLIGGLGNQMFQYALGRNLALKNDTQLYFDLSELLIRNESITHTFREFELNIFNIKYSGIKNTNTEPGVLDRIIRKLPSFNKLIIENGFLFDSGVLNQRGSIFLNGFWQNEKYFENIGNIIRNDFSFKFDIEGNNKKIFHLIQNSNSVSIHFRRGDYITNSSALNFHGVCSISYYQTAIDYIRQRVEKPHFFIFSDDMAWVKNNFEFQDAFTLVDINKGEKSYEDMRLMTYCKHNIIANSSFSWWGAWLNNNNEKIVIAPAKWFIATETDIIPDKWIKILN